MQDLQENLEKLSVLERRKVLAGLVNDQRVGAREREEEAKRQGYASTIARQHLQEIEARKPKVVKSWNQGGSFGAEGHHRYRKDRILIRKALKGEKEDDYKNKDVHIVQQQRITLVRKSIERNTASKLKEQCATAMTKLRQEIDEVRRMWQERDTMRYEEYVSKVLSMSSEDGSKPVDEESAVAKYYLALVQESCNSNKELFGERLKKMEAKLAKLKAEYKEKAETGVKEALICHTAVKAYITECQRRYIPESRQVISCLGKETIYLENYALDDDAFEAILECLPKVSPVLETLCMLHNKLEESMTLQLCKILSSGETFANLTALDLSRNHGIGTVGAIYVFETMQHTNLAALTLSACGIGAEMLEEFNKTCKKTLVAGFSNLKILNLSDNPLGPGFPKMLSEIMDRNLPLEELSLRYCDLGGHLKSDGVMALVRALRNGNVHTINFAMTNFHDAHVEVLAEILRNDTVLSCLRSVNISANPGITYKSCPSLAEALKKNQTLEVLLMGDCSFGFQGARVLLDVLNTNDTIQEFDCDHKRLVYNPANPDKTLERLEYLGSMQDQEFGAKLVAIDSLQRMEATLQVQGSVYGKRVLPKLIPGASEDDFKGGKVKESSLQKGFKCQAQIFGKYGSPWYNVEIYDPSPQLDVEEAGKRMVRVRLSDYLHQVDEFHHEYEPVLEWTNEEYVLEDNYPLVDVVNLRNFPNDIAVLELYAVEKNNKWTRLQREVVFFPTHMLPRWFLKPGQTAYFKTCEVKRENQKGPVFELASGIATMDLCCPNFATHYPNQTPIAVTWPRKALKPRPRLRDTALIDVLPNVIARKSAANIFQAPKLNPVYFAFYKNLGCETANLRLLKKQD